MRYTLTYSYVGPDGEEVHGQLDDVPVAMALEPHRRWAKTRDRYWADQWEQAMRLAAEQLAELEQSHRAMQRIMNEIFPGEYMPEEPRPPTVADPPLANPARRNENRPRRSWESPKWRR